MRGNLGRAPHQHTFFDMRAVVLMYHQFYVFDLDLASWCATAPKILPSSVTLLVSIDARRPVRRVQDQVLLYFDVWSLFFTPNTRARKRLFLFVPGQAGPRTPLAKTVTVC